MTAAMDQGAWLLLLTEDFAVVIVHMMEDMQGTFNCMKNAKVVRLGRVFTQIYKELLRGQCRNEVRGTV